MGQQFRYNPHIICKTLAVKFGGNKISRYAVGLKRCTKCNECFTIPDIKCPCCNFSLKTRSRANDSKRLFQRDIGKPKMKSIPKYIISNLEFDAIRNDIIKISNENKTISNESHRYGKRKDLALNIHLTKEVEMIVCCGIKMVKFSESWHTHQLMEHGKYIQPCQTPISKRLENNMTEKFKVQQQIKAEKKRNRYIIAQRKQTLYHGKLARIMNKVFN